MPAFIVWFQELSRSSGSFAGGKGANLGEMMRAGLPVPDGFVVTTAAFLAALDASGVRAELQSLFKSVDADSPQQLAEASARMRALVERAGIPPDVRAAIVDAYTRLGANTAVAVRSSATSEDTGATSFAGMHETYTNVVGEAALLAKVLSCWASAYGQRVIAYRTAEGMDEEPTIAVVVQKMIDSTRSGVMFTADPASGDRGTIVIEAAFGLGEVVVGGQVEVDTYVVDKPSEAVRSTRVGHKAFKIARDAGGHENKLPLGPDEAKRRVLADPEVIELARLGVRVEAHYGSPQDLEWAEEGGRFYLVQTRPITTLESQTDAQPPAGTVGPLDAAQRGTDLFKDHGAHTGTMARSRAVAQVEAPGPVRCPASTPGHPTPARRSVGSAPGSAFHRPVFEDMSFAHGFGGPGITSSTS